MDIRLKNRHKLGIVLIILTIGLTAVAALALYPYMEQKARSYNEQSQRSYENDTSENVAIQMINSVYSIWMEQEQKQAGHLLTPAQVFLSAPPKDDSPDDYLPKDDLSDDYLSIDDSPEDDSGIDDLSEYYREIQVFMDERGELWKSNYQQIANQLDYQMLDAQGKVLSERKQNTQANQVYAEVAFDSQGHMTVAYIQESLSDELSNALGQMLNRYADFDPVKDRFGYDYIYSGIEFRRPVDVTYKFWIPETMLTSNITGTGDVSISAMYYSGVTMHIAIFLIVLVSLIAVVLPCIPSLRLGQEKIFRAPFEIVTTVAGIGLVIVFEDYLLSAFVATTMNGLLATEIQRAGFNLVDAQDLAWILNGIMWAAGFAVVYWIITCYRSVFVIGLWRYLKERTLAGYFFCWVKKCWDRFYQSMLSIDFRQKSTKIILKLVLVNFLVLTLICCLWFFGVGAMVIYSVLLFWVLQKYWGQMYQKYEVLLDAFRQVAAGNFNTEIQEDLGVFEPFRDELDTIQDGLKQAVEKEVKSQKMKSDLITNVSHDLKTPLTAIITYVNLLKEDNLSEGERASYIAVLEQKSMRLKVLIEDLFEVSKANSNNITLHLEPVNVVSLMKQVRLELSDQIDQSEVDFRWDLPEDKIILTLDGQKTCRIFENLLLNITKYAMPGTRAYIDMKEIDGELYITMRNVSANELHVNGQELTERFVRGDESRNTEGSGLGLAIAKSFTEVQGGRLSAEIEADLFRVIICWPTFLPGESEGDFPRFTPDNSEANIVRY